MTLKSKMSSMTTIETRLFWPYSYILWKVVYKNTRDVYYSCSSHHLALRPRNTFVLSSGFLLSPLKLPMCLHSFLRQSYVIWSFWPRFMKILFGRQMVLSMPKKVDKENSPGAKVWLFLILSTTINQKVRKKIRVIGTLNYNSDCDCPIELVR